MQSSLSDNNSNMHKRSRKGNKSFKKCTFTCTVLINFYRDFGVKCRVHAERRRGWGLGVWMAGGTVRAECRVGVSIILLRY